MRETSRLTRHWVIVLGALTLVASCAGAAEKPARPDGAADKGTPIDARIERDVTYSTNGGVALKLDLYFPKTQNDQPAPLAVYIHGGGWRSGSKSVGTWLKDVTAELVARGYVVAAVEYRLAPKAQFPAFIYDVKAAVRFLRANAGKYHIDPDHIGAWGTSAGGHLVALLGTTDANDKLEGDGGNPEQSSRVQAVVDLFGPTDLQKMLRSEEMGKQAFGGTEGLKLASPVQYVTKDDPPFLILQGDSDKTVPPEQAKLLYDRLQAAGVESRLVMVKNGGHGLSGSDITPTKAEMVKMMADFFDQHLRRPAEKKPQAASHVQ